MKENRTPSHERTKDNCSAWKRERTLIRQFIVDTLIENMTEEDMIRSVRGLINERWYWVGDDELIKKYLSLGGEKTDLIKERF